MTSSGFFKKKARRPERFFNMVECALALAVVAIGVVSIVALFPVGMEASRDAIADSYAADSANNFLSYFKGQLQNTSTGWTDYVTGTGSKKLPLSKPYTTTSVPALPPDKIEADSWTTLSETPLIENHAEKGVFRIQVKSGNSADFCGVFRVWQQDVKYDSTNNLPTNIARSLYLEVSWPSQAPYDKRRRALYYLEVFNPNN